MNFLLRYSLGFDLLSLFILLVYTCITKPFGYIGNHDGVDTLVIMPVTTRAQARLLTGSSTELSTAISTGTRVLSTTRSTGIKVLSESSLLSQPTISSTDSPTNHSTVSNTTHSSSSSSLPLDHHCDRSISSPELFQISKFEIFGNFENIVQQVSNSSVPLSMKSVSSQFSIMEADYQDTTSDQKVSTDAMNLTQILTTLSHQITNQNTAIQEHIIRNDMNFQQIVQDNDDFKRDMRAELDDLRALLARNNIVSPSTVTSSATVIPVSTVQPTHSGTSVSPSSPSALPQLSTVSSTMSTNTSGGDIQTQMLLMLSESFAKLSTALTEKKDDPKADWPKFSGDHKKFRTWYLAIMAQLSLSPWQELYDSSTNNVFKTTTNSTLNGKLYAKLLLSLEGTVLQNVVSRTHLRANGLALLHDLVNTYKPRNVPEVIAAKTSNFWGSTKRQHSETVDEYYNRFHELLDELSDADEVISTKSAMRHFIFTLGNEFEAIQNNFRMGNLPSMWQTQDWPTLLVLCRDYFNSVKPYGITKSPSLSDPYQDRIAQRKKVKEWFMNPSKYSKEIEAEQCRHPGKCIFHLTKSHQTSNCDVKKECDKLLQSKKSSSSTNQSSSHHNGQLRHITEEHEAVSDVLDESSVVSNEETPNDTNDDLLIYFSRVSKHYLRLVKSTPDLQTRHSMAFPIIADSGANFHMFRDQAFFTSLTPFSGKVVLGDGQTTLNIQGIGTVTMQIGDHVLSIDNVRYIPDLAESIYSLFLHIRSPNHGLRSSFEDGLHIIFPTFSTKAILGTDDVYLDAVPVGYSTDNYPIQSTVKCNHITQLSHEEKICEKKADNLLRNLRTYYGDIKTKRQLNLEVPAGFRTSTNYQRQVRDYQLSNDVSADSSDKSTMA